MVETIGVAKSSDLTVYFQPHSPVNLLGCMDAPVQTYLYEFRVISSLRVSRYHHAYELVPLTT